MDSETWDRMKKVLSRMPETWSIEDTEPTAPPPVSVTQLPEAMDWSPEDSPSQGLRPGEDGYPFQALVDAVQQHTQENGGRFRVAEGWVNYAKCGHRLPAAIAIEVTHLPEERHHEKAAAGFEELASQPCPECARLAKAD